MDIYINIIPYISQFSTIEKRRNMSINAVLDVGSPDNYRKERFPTESA